MMPSATATRHRSKGPLFILGAAVLWSTAGATMKLCSLTGWQISCGRSLVAAAAIGLFMKSARVGLTWPIFGISAAYAGTVVLFALANKLTTSANAIFLQDTAPLYVLILSWWVLREAPGRDELAAVPLFLLGLALFFVDKLTPGQRDGNLLALASGLAFAACIVGLRHLSEANAAALLWGNALAALLSFVPALEGPAPSGFDLALVAYLGVFQLALSYVLFARGLQLTPAVEASLLALLEPVLNPIWTFFLAGERPGPWALTGGAVILGATAWRTLRSRRFLPQAGASPGG